MTTPSTSCRLTIFEGSDGGGKSTAAKAYAEDTGARYVHFGPLPRVRNNLGRMYVEAMLPALLGYQDVVFDRCWLSEVPYGSAFRKGADRLGIASVRMLERLAMRCGGVVIYCQPNWSTVRNNYASRKEIEYLDNEKQLQHVYEVYASQRTALGAISYDYTKSPSGIDEETVEVLRTERHPVDLNSAGNLEAKFLLVGDSFANHKDQDPWYQWPFASFNDHGCSQWLTRQLALGGICESNLLWANADQDLRSLVHLSIHQLTVVALGTEASQTLEALGITHDRVPHPQSHKRFNASQRYPLLDLLGGLK